MLMGHHDLQFLERSQGEQSFAVPSGELDQCPGYPTFRRVEAQCFDLIPGVHQTLIEKAKQIQTELGQIDHASEKSRSVQNRNPTLLMSHSFRSVTTLADEDLLAEDVTISQNAHDFPTSVRRCNHEPYGPTIQNVKTVRSVTLLVDDLVSLEN